MKRHLTNLSCLLGLASVFFALLLTSFSDAEVLHSWVESQPNHGFQNDNSVEYSFYTYTSKRASRSESGGSWQLTAEAKASANCQPVSPAPGNMNREWNADAQLRTTGDIETLHGPPCRPTSNLCQPETQPPLCQPITCPNADRR